MTKLTNPVPLFLDRRGALLDAGYIYVGVAGQDPVANPIALFFDQARTVPATQPLRTLGGRIVSGATFAAVYFAETDFSMLTRDADGNQCDYSPALTSAAMQYQPLDDDLSAIAANGTTAYGRGLLNTSNQIALRQATGIPDPLPIAGGQMQGNITRQNAGVHAYWANPAMTGGRKFLTVDTASDPTSQPGDEWNKYHV